jgi:N-dimethylarginine dimethylaminohydrolase
MCSPDYFDIVDVKNVHMEGNSGKVDKAKALAQWQSIHDIFKAEANSGNIDRLAVIAGAPGCEDMVFCANQSFPWLNEKDEPFVIMSRMKHASRQREVPFFEAYYQSLQYKIQPPPRYGLLEGMGDLIPVPGKKCIFGGYGHRTEIGTLGAIQDAIHCSVIRLQLVNDAFYHLDTCFLPLNTQHVLIAREAFNENGFEDIRKEFEHVYEIPLEESLHGFALNAHVVHGHHEPFAIIQQGNTETVEILTEQGFKVYEVDTSEFMKSGGSVFCMKMMHY